jgi:hypothetical protein
MPRQLQSVFEHRPLRPVTPTRFATSALKTIGNPNNHFYTDVMANVLSRNWRGGGVGVKSLHFKARIGERSRREPPGSRKASAHHLGTGGEAWGRSRKEPAVFKHRLKLPQHEERRTTNGEAFEVDT